MLGRLALGLLGGLGKGAMAAGGGKMALELAKMALGGKGRGAGRGGGTGGRGSQGGGRQQKMPLEELLGALSGEQKARAAGKIPSGRGSLRNQPRVLFAGKARAQPSWRTTMRRPCAVLRRIS